MQQKRKIVPPVYLLASMWLMYLSDLKLPLMSLVPESYSNLSLVFLGLGIMVIFWSFSLFSKADTGVVPFDEARVLVVNGMYKVTRNPMYLGMVMILFGVFFKLGSLGSLIPVPLFMAVIHFNFILGEEEFLEEAFGENYLEYKRRVRRWI